MFLRKFDSHLGCLDTALNQRSSTFGMRLARLQHCLKTLRCSNCLGNKHAQQACQLLRQVRCQTPAPLCRGTPIRPKKLTTAPRTTDWVLQRRLSSAAMNFVHASIIISTFTVRETMSIRCHIAKLEMPVPSYPEVWAFDDLICLWPACAHCVTSCNFLSLVVGWASAS